MNILIVDDEIRPAKRIAAVLSKNYPQYKEPAMVHNITHALSILQTESIDILFLDVEMPEMDGFDLLENMYLPSTPALIFTTAHEEYAARAFRVNAIDYLLKPVLSSQLIGAVEKARKYLDPKKQAIQSPVGTAKITVYENQSYHIVPINQLIRVEADGSYARFTLTDKQQLLSSKSLKYYEGLLEKQNFLRCHKSHLVNLDFVKSYTLADGGYVNLTNGEQVPLAVSKKRLLLDRLRLS